MKRILIFSHEYPPCLGGAGTVASSLKEGLELSQYDVTVLTSRRSSELKSHKVRTITLPSKLWCFSYFFELIPEVDKYDLIICNDPVAIYNAGRYFSKKILAKTICFIHGEEKYLNSKNLYLKFISFRNSFKRALKLSSKVIFVSHYIKERYLELYSISDDSLKNFCVIHSGLPVLQHNKVVSHLPGDVRNSDFSFITLSRVVEGKGFDTMFQIFLIFKHMNLSFKWTIAGAGDYLEALKEKILQSDIKDNVTFLGAVSRDNLKDVYSKHDYFLSLSELNESFGISYLEAASCGVIPIGYKRAGVPEAFHYITTGLLLDDFKDAKSLSKRIFEFINSVDKSNVQCLRTQKDFIKEVIDNV